MKTTIVTKMVLSLVAVMALGSVASVANADTIVGIGKCQAQEAGSNGTQEIGVDLTIRRDDGSSYADHKSFYVSPGPDEADDTKAVGTDEQSAMKACQDFVAAVRAQMP